MTFNQTLIQKRVAWQPRSPPPRSIVRVVDSLVAKIYIYFDEPSEGGLIIETSRSNNMARCLLTFPPRRMENRRVNAANVSGLDWNSSSPRPYERDTERDKNVQRLASRVVYLLVKIQVISAFKFKSRLFRRGRGDFRCRAPLNFSGRLWFILTLAIEE